MLLQLIQCKLFEICKENNFLPKCKFIGVSNDEIDSLRVKIELMNLFEEYDSKPNVAKVKKIIGKTKIVIDSDIMVSLFKNTKRSTIAEYLISLGGIIDDRCFDNMIYNGDLTKDQKLIAEGYKKYMKEKLEKLEKN